MRRILPLFLLLIASLSSAAAHGQQFKMSGGILSAPWQSPAISADGSKIHVPTFPEPSIGGPPAYYFYSGNTGVTWSKQTSSGNRLWVFGCTSSDGTIVYGADQGSAGGFIYKSTDSGVTWNVTNSPQLAWQQVSCSSDGTKLVACVGSQIAQADIYTSIDGGTTWVDQTGSLSRNYLACVISGDGTKIATANWAGKGANGDGCIYVSTNWQSGSPTWAENICAANGATFAQALAYSRDGSTIYAGFNANGNTSHIFKSTNDGGNWTDINPPGGTVNQRVWYNIACSANGNTVIADNSIPLEYVSTNGGTTWSSAQVVAPNGPVNAAYYAVSDSGSIIVKTVYLGFIYISLNSGAAGSWRITSATGP